MNITDQIIEAANIDHKFQTSDISRRASNLIREDQIEYYKTHYQQLSKEVNKSKFSTRLPLSKMLLFNAYGEISDLCRSVFKPLSTHREIVFNDIKTDSPRMGKLHTPEVHHHFDFSRDTPNGAELTAYLTQLYILKWLKIQMGFDMLQYPNKYHLVVFKQDNTIYVWKNDSIVKERLYIDKTANEKILDAYHDIYYKQKGGGILSPLLEGLPYKEGDEAKKIFDINWYKHKKQTPLTYRCFPNTFTLIITPDPNPNLCKHSGEYCIDKNELDKRYSRFLNIYNHLNDVARFDLVKNTIELFEKFMLTGSFTKLSHSEHYTIIMEKLRTINKKVRLDVDDEILKCLGNGLESFIEQKVSEQEERDNLAISARFNPKEVLNFKNNEKDSIYKELKNCDPLVAPFISSFIHSVKIEKDYKKHRIDSCTDFINREFFAQVKEVGGQFYSIEEVENISDFNCMFYIENYIMTADRQKFNTFIHHIILASRLFKLDELTQAVKTQPDTKAVLPNNQSYNINKLNSFYYQLNIVENKSHKTIQTLCQGFPIYLLWTNANNKNVATVFKKHPRYDTPEQKKVFFNSYFNPLIEKEKNATPTFQIFNEQEFVKTHIQTEQENFQLLENLNNYDPALPINIIENWLNDYITHLKNLFHLDKTLQKTIPTLIKSKPKTQINMISPDSRYYMQLETLKNIINSDHAFNLVYNEDKRTYHLPYLYEGYKNEINVSSEIDRIYKRIKKVFSDNLFKPNEIILLIENLMPTVEDYGKRTRSSLGFKNAKLRKGSPLKVEYEKTIVALNEIKDALKNKLGVLYKNLLRVEEYKLKFTELEKIQDELLNSYATIVAAGFTLMKIAFEGSMQGSVAPDELLRQEISIVDNIILKGEHYDIILKDQSNLFPLNPPIINNIYRKLVRGLEVNLIDEYASNLNSDSYDQLVNTKALIMYKDFLANYKLENNSNESSISPKKLPPKPNRKVLPSFTYIHYNDSLRKITTLMNDLKLATLIDNDTDLQNFRKVFNGSAIEQKIIWTGSLSELYYFIRELYTVQQKVKNLYQKQWFVTVNCFKPVGNGNEFDRLKFRGQKKPATSNAIESIVSKL